MSFRRKITLKAKTTLLLAVTILAGIPAMAQIPVNCGDTLDIPGGVYVLAASLTCPSAPAVHIVANNVTFDMQGFTLSKSGSAVGAGIITAGGPTCVVTNGISIHHGTVSGFGTGISLCVPTSPGVSSANTNAQIHHMTLTGNSVGLALFNADGNDVHHNTVDANLGTTTTTPGTGIALFGSGGNQIHQNEVKANFTNGIALLFSSSNNNLSHNEVANNHASGILVTIGALGNVIKHNEATGDGAFDATEYNASCGTNVWQMNVFSTKNQACIQ